MKPQRKKSPARKSQLSVSWQDSAWFPPVFAQSRFPNPRSRRIHWPVQIITDPTVCVGRAVNVQP
jgi:hypothetical protein